MNQNGHVVFDKGRTEPNQVKEKGIMIIGNVRNKNVIFVDDLIDTAGTLIADVRVAKKAGAEKIYAFVTHGFFSRDAISKLDDSPITELVVTDNAPHAPQELKSKRVEITVLSVASLLADAIRRIHDGQSISELITQHKMNLELKNPLRLLLFKTQCSALLLVAVSPACHAPAA